MVARASVKRQIGIFPPCIGMDSCTACELNDDPSDFDHVLWFEARLLKPSRYTYTHLLVSTTLYKLDWLSKRLSKMNYMQDLSSFAFDLVVPGYGSICIRCLLHHCFIFKPQTYVLFFQAKLYVVTTSGLGILVMFILIGSHNRDGRAQHPKSVG